MGLLQNCKAYLCGPAEADSNCMTWRSILSRQLREIGIEPINPLEKPVWLHDTGPDKQKQIKEQILDGDLSNIKTNSNIREYCLSLVRMSDIIIINIYNFHTVGSFEEINECKYKPIFILSDREIPSMWLLDQLNIYHTRKFYIHYDGLIDDSIRKLIKTLKNIDDGTNKSYESSINEMIKWIFITRKISK